jgi:hypothetical protein
MLFEGLPKTRFGDPDVVPVHRRAANDSRGAGRPYDGRDVPTSNLPRRLRWYQAVYRRAVRAALGVDVPDSTYGLRAGLTGHGMSVCSEVTFMVLLAGGETRMLGRAGLHRAGLRWV